MLLICLVESSTVAATLECPGHMPILERRQDNATDTISSMISVSSSSPIFPTSLQLSNTVSAGTTTAPDNEDPSVSSNIMSASTTEDTTTADIRSALSSDSTASAPASGAEGSSGVTSVVQNTATIAKTTGKVITSGVTTKTGITTIITTISNVPTTQYSTSTTVETPTAVLDSGESITESQASEGAPTGPKGRLSSETKNTIIGAVVGVGGAMLLGGLGMVLWRLRKSQINSVVNGDLGRHEGSPLSAGQDMHSASPEASPFQAALDQYHKQPGSVNASSNF